MAVLRLVLPAMPALALCFAACTKDAQNHLVRATQDWTGVNGVLDVISGGRVLYRFINVETLTTETTDQGFAGSAFRYGYGIFDANFNYKADQGEKKVYFEVGQKGTTYQFYQNPVN